MHPFLVLVCFLSLHLHSGLSLQSEPLLLCFCLHSQQYGIQIQGKCNSVELPDYTT